MSVLLDFVGNLSYPKYQFYVSSKLGHLTDDEMKPSNFKVKSIVIREVNHGRKIIIDNDFISHATKLDGDDFHESGIRFDIVMRFDNKKIKCIMDVLVLQDIGSFTITNKQIDDQRNYDLMGLIIEFDHGRGE